MTNVCFVFVDLPVIINQRKEVKGSTVQIYWEQGSCNAAINTVFYREAVARDKYQQVGGS